MLHISNVLLINGRPTDFVARKNDCIDYFQVTASMLEESTLKDIEEAYPTSENKLDGVIKITITPDTPTATGWR